MKFILIVAIISLNLQILHAKPNGDKDEPKIIVKPSGTPSSDGVGNQTSSTSTTSSVVKSDGGEEITTTTTITKSSISASFLSGGVIECKSKNCQIIDDDDDDEDCDCNCNHHLYDDDDVGDDDCGAQLIKSKLKISTLTKARRSVLGELNACRVKYATVSGDFEKITTEVKNLKQKLQVARDNNAKLKTQLIAANADAQKWKSKSDSLEISLKKALDNNAQSKKTVDECSKTISNLQLTIKEITIKNNKCEADSDECKRKWEAENAKVIKSEKRIKELEASNDDLKTKINKLTDDLTTCQTGNQQNDIEINKYKNTVSNLTNQFSNCTVYLGSCNSALKRATDDFDADQRSDSEKEKLRAKLELQLNECDTTKKDTEKNLQSERKNVGQCKEELATVRDECSKQAKKCDADITYLKSSSKLSIDQCEASLKSEKENSANCRNDTTKLQNRIVEIEAQLTTANKTADDWQKRNKICEDDSTTAKQTIETLRTNLADTNRHLTDCVANGNSLQTDVTSCKSKLDDCSGDLGRTKSKLADDEMIIENQKNKIGSLDAENKRCQTELSVLRCDVDGHLAGVRDAEQKVYVALQQALSILDGNTKASNDFIGSRNISCKAS